MIGSIRAELFKFTRRPAIWILGAVLVLIIGLLGYVIGWIVFSHPPQGSNFTRGIDRQAALRAFYPASFVKETISTGASLGGALSMVLGALAVGSEYGWGTFKTVLTQRPGRLTVFFGRLVALAVIVLVFDLATYATGAVVSAILATVDHQALQWPSASDIVRALGATWLIFMTWTLFGVFLAYLFRQSALAIGIGLVYMLVVEGLVVGLLGPVGGDLIKNIERVLPGTNASDLVTSFGRAFRARNDLAQPALVSATQAVITLSLYVIGFAVAAAAVFRTRDIT